MGKQLQDVDCMTKLIRDDTEKIHACVSPYDPLDHAYGNNFDTLSVEEKRVQLVQTVRNAVGQLGGKVADALEDEVQLFEKRQREIEIQHRDMQTCVTDSHRMLQRLRQQTDAVMEQLGTENYFRIEDATGGTGMWRELPEQSTA